MRFCLLTTFYPPFNFGGDGIYVQRLARALVRCGHHVEVIHCIDSYRLLASIGGVKRPAGDPPQLQCGEDGVIVHGLQSPFGGFSPLATHLTGLPLFKRKRIASILEKGRFDVIHFHNISLLGGPGVLALGKGIKLYTMHEHWLLCATHVLFRYQRSLCTRRTCGRCQLMHRRPIQLWRSTPLLRRSLRHVDAFLSLTRFTLELHRLHFPDLPWQRLPPFAVPLEPDQEIQVPAGLPDRPFFLYVGRLERLKGLQTLLPLFAPGEAGAEPPADLVVVGDGRLADGLRRRISAGADRIHWLGHLEPHRLLPVYQRAIAVILPSLTYEVFSQVIVEAFSAGTPVVARDLGPLPEIIDEAGGGLTYRNDGELLTHLRALREEPARREALGRAGRSAVARLWAEEDVIHRYLEIIKRLRDGKVHPAVA